jgi:hypothetical protein
MFMRYVMARYESEQRELAYRIYVTETLRKISESTANFGGGEYMRARFADLIKIDHRPEDNRTSEEIIGGIREKLRKMQEP